MRMQLSISRLAVTLIVLLIAVTLITSATGVYMLQSQYQSLGAHHDAQAADTARNAALSIRNQLRFYQGILQQISASPEIANLFDFGEQFEMVAWANNLAGVLPGTIGAALASEHGAVFGDPMAQRVGPACQVDLRNFSAGKVVEYPPLHTDVVGLEHFDLLTRVVTADGETSGTLFVSFHLNVIQELLLQMRGDHDQFRLETSDGRNHLTVGEPLADTDVDTFRVKVPDTTWQLVLRRPMPANDNALLTLVLADLLILAASALIVVVLIRAALGGFQRDMARVHDALTAVLDGLYRPSPAPTSIRETAILLPDIERLALRLQEQREELREQSLSDPLTGVYNRRYFDLMLRHLHEQSRRQTPATLAIIDLNDFKAVNDAFGHQAGDRVLQHLGRFLRARVRSTDIVARLGGDEFALLLTQMPLEVSGAWLDALVRDFDRQIDERMDERNAFCRLSIGAAAVDAAQYPSADAAFEAADRAMYSVKPRDGNSASRFAVAAAHVDQAERFTAPAP